MTEPTNDDSHQALVHLWRFLRSKGVFGAVVTAAVGASGWGYALVSQKSGPTDLVPCFQATNYPKGDWLEGARFTDYDPKKGPPAAADRITFVTENYGTWISNELGTTVAEFRVVEGKIAPGEVVRIESVDNSAKTDVKYRSTSIMRVSNDGCRMDSEWVDNNDQVKPGNHLHRGTAVLVWLAPGSYWVKRGPDQPVRTGVSLPQR